MEIKIKTEALAERINTELVTWLWEAWEASGDFERYDFVMKYRSEKAFNLCWAFGMAGVDVNVKRDSDNGLPCGCEICGEFFPVRFDEQRRKYDARKQMQK